MNKQTLIYVFLIAAIVKVSTSTVLLSTKETKDEFEMWKSKFNIEFSETENPFRSIVFNKNLLIINAHNSKADRTYDMGLNQFSALTDKEFVALYLNPKPFNPEWKNVDKTFQKVGVHIDWVIQGKVSPVKIQGQCGSCWAFSAVAVLESFALLNNQTVNLSEQQLVDCSRKYGNIGCNGGFSYYALAYVKDHGITSEADYTYIAKNGACKSDGGSFTIKNVQTVNGCTEILNALQSRPIGVCVDATNWNKYSSGIFSDCGTNLNHDALLVGVTEAFWKIKNSWGTSFGEKGFIRLAQGNTCGICIDKSPFVE